MKTTLFILISGPEKPTSASRTVMLHVSISPFSLIYSARVQYCDIVAFMLQAQRHISSPAFLNDPKDAATKIKAFPEFLDHHILDRLSSSVGVSALVKPRSSIIHSPKWVTSPQSGERPQIFAQVTHFSVSSLLFHASDHHSPHVSHRHYACFIFIFPTPSPSASFGQIRQLIFLLQVWMSSIHGTYSRGKLWRICQMKAKWLWRLGEKCFRSTLRSV